MLTTAIKKLTFFHPRFLFYILLTIVVSTALGQTTIVEDSAHISGTTVVIPGKHYDRGGLHTFFWGTHYRKEWATAARINNLYLDTAKGGLHITKEGGSRQTKGLRLENKNGKEYVLRSIDKDFGNGLEEQFHGTFLSRIAKDQASIGYPFAAITIPGMAEVAGIYHTNPDIVFIPKQAAFGEYNEEYGDQLYLLEERPDENQEDVASFGNAKNVIGTEKLFEKLYKDNDNRVDQVAFVRARLFDMFIGDWGRHGDQWRWAEFEGDKQTIYKPIPRDRDQAYTRINGFFPNLAGGPLKQIQGFNYDIKKIGKFNFAGRNLDPYFTNELTKDIWLQQAKELQLVLTDEVIEKNLRLLPPTHFAISGEEIIAKLKSRREHLQEYANDYYNYLAANVDLLGSDKKELFEIKRLSDTETQINIFKINKEDEVKKEPFYSRIFNSAETKEIRIYSLDDADKIISTGNETKNILVRVIDPFATDSIAVTKSNRLKVYTGEKYDLDTAHKKSVKIGITPLLTHPLYAVFDNDLFYHFPRTGIKISANILITPKRWKKDEYETQHLFNASYGFVRGAVNVGYVGLFPKAIGNVDFIIKARADIPAIESFYGIGNETIADVKSSSFYRTYSHRYFAAMGFQKITEHHNVELIGIYQAVRVDRKNGKYLSGLDPNLPEYITNQYTGGEVAYRYRDVNDNVFPTKGFRFSIGGLYLNNIKKQNTSFTNFKSDVAFYLPLGKQFSIASRAAVAILSGEANFYHLNKLKGNLDLRGYNRERFYGKSAFNNNNELRWATNTRNFLFTGKIGLLSFYDIGRVWQPLETSNTWHTGYGGGFFIIPFNKLFLIATYEVPNSNSGSLIELRTGVYF